MTTTNEDAPARRTSQSYRHLRTSHLVSNSPFRQHTPAEKRPRPVSLEAENARPMVLKRDRRQSMAYQHLVHSEPVTNSPFKLPTTSSRPNSSPTRSALVSRRLHGPRLSAAAAASAASAAGITLPTPAVTRRMRRKTVTWDETCDVVEFDAESEEEEEDGWFSSEGDGDGDGGNSDGEADMDVDGDEHDDTPPTPPAKDIIAPPLDDPSANTYSDSSLVPFADCPAPDSPPAASYTIAELSFASTASELSFTLDGTPRDHADEDADGDDAEAQMMQLEKELGITLGLPHVSPSSGKNIASGDGQDHERSHNSSFDFDSIPHLQPAPLAPDSASESSTAVSVSLSSRESAYTTASQSSPVQEKAREVDEAPRAAEAHAESSRVLQPSTESPRAVKPSIRSPHAVKPSVESSRAVKPSVESPLAVKPSVESPRASTPIPPPMRRTRAISPLPRRVTPTLTPSASVESGSSTPSPGRPQRVRISREEVLRRMKNRLSGSGSPSSVAERQSEQYAEARSTVEEGRSTAKDGGQMITDNKNLEEIVEEVEKGDQRTLAPDPEPDDGSSQDVSAELATIQCAEKRLLASPLTNTAATTSDKTTGASPAPISPLPRESKVARRSGSGSPRHSPDQALDASRDDDDRGPVVSPQQQASPARGWSPAAGTAASPSPRHDLPLDLDLKSGLEIHWDVEGDLGLGFSAGVEAVGNVRADVDVDMRSALDRLMEDVAVANGGLVNERGHAEGQQMDMDLQEGESREDRVDGDREDSVHLAHAEDPVPTPAPQHDPHPALPTPRAPSVGARDAIRAREEAILEKRREARRREDREAMGRSTPPRLPPAETSSEEEEDMQAGPVSHFAARAGTPKPRKAGLQGKGRPSRRRSRSTGDAGGLLGERARGVLGAASGLLDAVPVFEAADDPLEDSINRELRKLDRTAAASKYQVRERAGTIYASADRDRIEHVGDAGDVDGGRAWRTVRRPSDMNEYSKQIKEYRAQEKGKAHGKVFVKVLGVRGLTIPIPVEPTALTCTLNNGIHFVTTPECRLARDCKIEQEFELIEHSKLEFTLTLKVRRDPHIVAQSKAIAEPLVTSPPVLSAPPKSSGGGMRFLFSSSPKKPKAAGRRGETPPPPTPPQKPVENLARYLKPDGTLARAFVAFRDVHGRCDTRLFETTIPLIGQRVEPGAGGKTRTTQVGELAIQLFRLPPLPGISPEQLPQSLDECHRGLRHVAWHKVTYFEGTLTQNGGDCTTWRRRQLRVIGANLVAFNDVTKKATAAIDLRKALDVIDDQATRSVAHSPLIDEYEGLSGMERSFRLKFPHDQEIVFFADSDEEKARWLDVLRALVGHIPPNPLWAELVWQRQQELGKLHNGGGASARFPPSSPTPAMMQTRTR